MPDVLCLGEVVIDWIRSFPEGTNQGNLERHLAGVPANVAVALARQGVKSAIIACIGNDSQGLWAKAELEREGIDVTGLVLDRQAITRSAQIVRNSNGERQTLSVEMHNCADRNLAPEHLQPAQFEQASALYFDSTALSAEPAASAVKLALDRASTNNLLVVSDSNIWPAMWASDTACRETVLHHLRQIDVLKLSEGELEFLTGSATMVAAELLKLEHGIPLLIVTLAERGCFMISTAGSALVAPPEVKVVEPAGAGDAFVGTMIAGLLPQLSGSGSRRKQLRELPLSTLVQIAARANAAGAIVCSRYGALPAMPTTAEIDELLAR
jgi:sugar/nucleoside kinase (ribokinase family)